MTLSLSHYTQLPPGSLCRYRGTPFDLSLHVESLYKLIPYLSELNSSEAQHLSESLSEDIFPVITELMVRPSWNTMSQYLCNFLYKIIAG